MSKNTLFDKVWEKHTVATLDGGQTQLFIGLHLLHEVTSPQAFSMIRDRKLSVSMPNRTFATVDHVVPTEDNSRPYEDAIAEEMMCAIENNTKENGIELFNVGTGKQGVIHIVAPEQGLTQPGMTVACGDSHTATHGAFGAIAFGIGTSQVRDVLATQTLSMGSLKVRKIQVDGKLSEFVTAKDLILHIIRTLGVNGGTGHAYEFTGEGIKALSMEERMTVCNMAIEGGARVGYINSDETTYEYLRGRPHAPKDFEKAIEYWESMKTEEDAEFDDVVVFNASEIEPVVTWGITPAQAIGVSENIPALSDFEEKDQKVVAEAYEYMDVKPGTSMIGQKLDVVFIGSCTNGRMSDLRAACDIIKKHGGKVADGLKAFVVPGSEIVKKLAEEEGLDKIFTDHGWEWRNAGCSICLAMNPDKLKGRQISASTTNRNFKGRQGSPTGRTVLVSPEMAVAAAVTGQVTDIREFMKGVN